MNYEKPVVGIADAIKVVQFQQSKVNGSVSDAHMSQTGWPAPLTATAYEADE